MGFRVHVELRAEARRLRADSLTLAEIASRLGVAKSSVSVWVREVDFIPRPRSSARKRGPNRLQVAKQAEIESALQWGRETIATLSERDFLIAGAALYAGEGAKTDGCAKFANSDPRMVVLFLAWLRRFFEIDERRLRAALYLHEGLDVEAVRFFWSSLTGIPESQFFKPYRAVPDSSLRSVKHPMGCLAVVYNSTSVHRRLMGLVTALLTFDGVFRGSSTAEHSAVNRQVVSSNLTPGAPASSAVGGQ